MQLNYKMQTKDMWKEAALPPESSFQWQGT